MEFLRLFNGPFGSLVLGALAAFLFGQSIRGWRVARASRTWPMVEGRVTDARPVQEEDQSDHWVGFVCQYVVNGETFHHHDMLHDRWPLAVAREKAWDREGRRMKVYYDPDDPSHATFNPGGITSALFLMILAAALLGVAVLLIWRWWPY